MKRKSRKREVTDEEFRIAHDSIDNQRIIHKVCGRFMDRLSSDMLKQCGLDALWRALQSHDTRYKRKFTSSLYQFTEWECQRALGGLYGDRIQAETLCVDVVADDTAKQNAILANELLDYLDEQPCKILRDRYIFNYTLKEIADKYGYTPPGIQYIIKKALKQLREVDIGV